MKTRKIMEINEGGLHLACYKEARSDNPYRLVTLWYENGGWHRKTLIRYQNFESIMFHLMDMMRTPAFDAWRRDYIKLN